MKVCVFCGSSEGSDPLYMQAAEEMGKLIAQNDWSLVYGGGTRGLMGQVARSVVKNGSSCVGIIPQALIQREMDGIPPTAEEYGETIVVTDMHTRKKMMAEKAQAFLALPGGYGTLEELFEIVTWNQLGIHACPIVILNTNGFYDGLMVWLKTALGAGFVRQTQGSIFVEAKTPQEAIAAIENYIPASGRLDLDWSLEASRQGTPSA